MQTQLFPTTGILLVEQDYKGENKELLLTHYAGSQGVMGRRIVYAIFYQGKKIGIIGIQSVSLPIKRVANILYSENSKLDYDLKIQYFNEVYNNNIFRIEVREKNLATQILSLFRKKVFEDMKKKYNIIMKAIISMSFGENRQGICYQADNWYYLGLTSGAKKHMSVHKGKVTISVEQVEKKHLYLWVYNKELHKKLKQQQNERRNEH